MTADDFTNFTYMVLPILAKQKRNTQHGYVERPSLKDSGTKTIDVRFFLERSSFVNQSRPFKHYL